MFKVLVKSLCMHFLLMLNIDSDVKIKRGVTIQTLLPLARCFCLVSEVVSLDLMDLGIYSEQSGSEAGTLIFFIW